MTVFGKKIEDVDLSVWLALLLALLFILHDDTSPVGRAFGRVSEMFKNIWSGFWWLIDKIFSFFDNLPVVDDKYKELFGDPPLYPDRIYLPWDRERIVSEQGRNGGKYGTYWKEHPIKGVHDKHF